MISSNTFKTMQRATEANLFCINTICLDIDYKKNEGHKDLRPQNIIKLLEIDCIGSILPEPTYIEYSNQLRLIYVLSELVYIPKGSVKVRTLCNRVSKTFSCMIKEEYYSETQKCEKFLRVPHSVNTKNMSEVQIKKIF